MRSKLRAIWLMIAQRCVLLKQRFSMVFFCRTPMQAVCFGAPYMLLVSPSYSSGSFAQRSLREHAERMRTAGWIVVELSASGVMPIGMTAVEIVVFPEASETPICQGLQLRQSLDHLADWRSSQNVWRLSRLPLPSSVEFELLTALRALGHLS